MADDIVTRLRWAYKNADEVASVFLTNEAANEIERLVTQLRIQAEVVNGKNYHTISGGLHLDAADEIERLRASLHDIAEHLGNALYSDEWRTREYAIVAFGMYERAHPEHERDIDKMVDQ